jgi:hypothetical protein
MAAPQVRAVGSVQQAVAAVTPGLPAGTEAGDLLVMGMENGGAAALGEAVPVPTVSGWTILETIQIGNTRATVFYKVAAGGDATTTSDTGDHQQARIIGIKKETFNLSNPFNVVAAGTQAATTAVSILGATTTVPECLVCALTAGNLPDAASTTEFSGVANGSLTSVTERWDNTTNLGDGGSFALVSGIKAVAGAYGATSLTALNEAERANISFAIAPPAAEANAPLAAATGQSASAALGVTAPVRVPAASATGHSTTASLGITAPARPPLVAAAGQSSTALGKLSFSATLGLQAAHGESGTAGASLLFSEELLFGPGVLFGSANSFLRLFTPTQLLLQPAAGESSTSMGTQASTGMPLSAATGQSTTSMGAIRTAAQILPNPATGQSTTALGISGATSVLLAPATGASTTSMRVTAATGAGLKSAVGQSTASLALTGTGAVLLSSAGGQSTTALGINAETFLPAMVAEGQSETSFTLGVPVLLDLSRSEGRSETFLSVAPPSQLGPLLAQGISTTSLEGPVLRAIELLDEGRDGRVEGGDPGAAHRGRIGDLSWAI